MEAAAAGAGLWWGCDAPADSRPLIGRLPISGFDTRFASGSSLRGPPVALREPAPLVGGHLPPGARAAVRGSGSGSGAAAASWAGALRGLHAKRVKPVWALPRSAPLHFFFFCSPWRTAAQVYGAGAGLSGSASSRACERVGWCAKRPRGGWAIRAAREVSYAPSVRSNGRVSSVKDDAVADLKMGDGIVIAFI